MVYIIIVTFATIKNIIDMRPFPNRLHCKCTYMQYTYT